MCADSLKLDAPRVGAKIKEMFFDRKAVKNAVDRATWKVLLKFGAFVRRGAISSIRDSKTVSRPGEPPHSHLGARRRAANRRRKAQGLSPIRGGFKGIKHIEFKFDPQTKSVVIGPVAKHSVGVVPPLLEYGGTGTVVSGGKTKTATFKARPFMGPAMQREVPKLPAMWAGSVK